MVHMNYGVIGNGQSAALVSEQGVIEWCCLPAFDSPSAFAQLLDRERGGHFGIDMPGDNVSYEQKYLPRTNILVTRYSNGTDAFEVIDFMPRYPDRNNVICPPEIVRKIRRLSGSPRMVIDFQPRLAYAKGETTTTVEANFIKSVCNEPSYESIYLYSDLATEALLEAQVVDVNEDHFILLSYNQKIVRPTHETIDLAYARTKVYWMNWIDRSIKFEGWDESVERSLLVLMLLAYQPTGAVLAAVTTSLPEEVGGVRNWDYRFCWLRDASMVVKVFSQLGHYPVSGRYLDFILDVIPFKNDNVQIMYGINRQKELTESSLDWLSGYGNSSPVRIGNAAYEQKQHDIYGFVLDTIYQRLTDHSESLINSEQIWTVVRTLVRHVESQWRNPDAGIWEIRGDKKHFVFSKVLCWVAIDRAIKIAEFFNQTAPLEDWKTIRDEIYEQVMTKGWNEEIQAFSQAYGDTHMDASNLLMEHYGMIAADDPKYVRTVNRCYDELCRDGLMFRYKNIDDFGEPHSAFTVCTFWMIKSLHRIGKKELASQMFKDVVSHTNHVGLLSEDMEFNTHQLLGNFPQGYSHLALIDTAHALSQ